jgi:anti-sigma-K factor RskA
VNVQQYISGGIVESYVLGLAEPFEREEFERMCSIYPEVREMRDAFESSLEEFALMNQSVPPKSVKGRVFAEIDMESGNHESGDENFSYRNEPAKSFRLEGKARNINRWQRNLAAAAVILLLFSTALNFYFFNKYREYDKRYQALVISQSELAMHDQVLQTRLMDYEKAVEWMKDPNMAIVKMPAIPLGPDPSSVTTVYWDTLSKDVYLAVNQLPAPSAGEQYQLWAMVDGKPVDAGVFDIAKGAGVMKMKNIPRAEAFAITLEKKGGSDKPSMDKLYVMGRV